MLNRWLQRKQEAIVQPLPPAQSLPAARGGKEGSPAWMAAPGNGLVRWEQGRVERVMGNGRDVSKWADTGFRCCLDAKVVLLSEEPCGFISCSLAELTLAMLKLAAQAGEFTWGKHCP